MADPTTAAPDLPAVDTSPISPIERRNSLEKHLQSRPDAKDLKDRHILLDTNAAPYVSVAPPPLPCSFVLGFGMAFVWGWNGKGKGKRKGEKWERDDEYGEARGREEGKRSRNLLLTGVRNRALQSAAQDLERQRATDSLRKGLEKRPEKEELVERMFLFLSTFSLSLTSIIPFPCHPDNANHAQLTTFSAQATSYPTRTLRRPCKGSNGSWKSICVQIAWSTSYSSGRGRRSWLGRGFWRRGRIRRSDCLRSGCRRVGWRFERSIYPPPQKCTASSVGGMVRQLKRRV